MIIAIHQPNYIPWLGLFHKIYMSDKFVFLDDAQYSNQANHNRNTIKTSQGELLLTVPVTFKLGDEIRDVKIVNNNWRRKHLRTIQQNYSKAKYYKEVYPIIEEIIMKKHKTISELNKEIIIEFSKKFGIKTKFYNSSSFKSDATLDDRVIELCKKYDANIYFSGNGARVYQSEEKFNKNDLKLIYQEYNPVKYNQLWSGFIKNLSVIDYIMNCGFNLPNEWSRL